MLDTEPWYLFFLLKHEKTDERLFFLYPHSNCLTLCSQRCYNEDNHVWTILWNLKLEMFRFRATCRRLWTFSAKGMKICQVRYCIKIELLSVWCDNLSSSKLNKTYCMYLFQKIVTSFFNFILTVSWICQNLVDISPMFFLWFLDDMQFLNVLSFQPQLTLTYPQVTSDVMLHRAAPKMGNYPASRASYGDHQDQQEKLMKALAKAAQATDSSMITRRSANRRSRESTTLMTNPFYDLRTKSVTSCSSCSCCCFYWQFDIVCYTSFYLLQNFLSSNFFALT